MQLINKVKRSQNKADKPEKYARLDDYHAGGEKEKIVEENRFFDDEDEALVRAFAAHIRTAVLNCERES